MLGLKDAATGNVASEGSVDNGTEIVTADDDDECDGGDDGDGDGHCDTEDLIEEEKNTINNNESGQCNGNTTNIVAGPDDADIGSKRERVGILKDDQPELKK